MIKKLLPRLLLAVILTGTIQTTEAQLFKKKKKNTEQKKEDKSKPGDIQPYDKVITKDAKTDEGLFSVHTVDDKRYYEIPDS